MKIKYFIIILLILFTAVSCSKVEIIADSYWIHIVDDFKGNAFKLKIESFIRGNLLGFSIVDVKVDLTDLTPLIESDSDIVLLSPLLSTEIDKYSIQSDSKIIYYFNISDDSRSDNGDNLIRVERDRKESFFEMGKLVRKTFDSSSALPVIYSVKNRIQQEEVLNFLDGFHFSEEIIDDISFIVDDSTTEMHIRNFFDSEMVKNSEYIVVFANKWKNLCYEISERDSKYIVSSDSWFKNTFSSSILYSIEDDISGMLKKVYYNAKTNNLEDITLEGYIYK